MQVGLFCLLLATAAVASRPTPSGAFSDRPSRVGEPGQLETPADKAAAGATSGIREWQTQITQGVSQLRFVTHPSVNGCVVFVYERISSAGSVQDLEAEPVMCVRAERLDSFTPRYDTVTQQTYVNVPVVVTDEAMLSSVQTMLSYRTHGLRVRSARVLDISVAADSGSVLQALEFDWQPENSTGMLKLGCRNQSVLHLAFITAPLSGKTEVLNGIVATAFIVTQGGSIASREYRLAVQNQVFFDASIDRQANLPTCLMKFVRSARLNSNCTARVHRILNKKGHFVIEPLLCCNVANLNNESIMYDYSRDMHYVNLQVLLKDGLITENYVKTQLADLSPLHVFFMHLWRAQIIVSPTLSQRYVIGPLTVSQTRMSAQLRVYCRTEQQCNSLMKSISTDASRLLRRIKLRVTSLVSNGCMQRPVVRFISSHPDSLSGSRVPPPVLFDLSRFWMETCRERIQQRLPLPQGCLSVRKSDGRQFVMILQRLTGKLSFQRTWNEYEAGFGDETDFWIGLQTIHTLSSNGATLRIEAKCWNGTELHAEYEKFTVGNASTNYKMTYHEMLRNRSSIRYDALKYSQEMQFSTKDRDNDLDSGSCSSFRGNGGWWFHSCHHNLYPTGLFPSVENQNWSYVAWFSGAKYLSLREVRLMLQI